MSVKPYAPGEHPAGFIGFRVTRGFNGEYRQEYFSTREAETQDETDWFYRYQHLRAQYLDTKWAMESLWHQYQVFVTQDNPRTTPYRGVGVHGITIAFTRWNEVYLEPCFIVNHKKSITGRNASRFYLRNYRFSDAWKLAVNTWADEYDILEVDRKRVLANPPAPEQFKQLRTHMNEVEGYDIPVSTLGSVFREQREALRQQRLQHLAREMKLTNTALGPSKTDVEAEMLDWFNQNKEKPDQDDRPSQA